MHNISVVIRTKNEEKDLERTLLILKKQRGDFNLEIIVVDSGSTDCTLDIAKRYSAIIVNILPEEFTWGKALNEGILHASCELVFIISAHCFLQNENTLQKGIHFMKDYNLDVVYGKQIGDPDKNVYECAELFFDYPDVDIEVPKTNKMHGISNACCLLKRYVWEKIPFDEKLQSSEDADWFLKVLERNYKLAYTNKIVLIHGHYNKVDYIYRRCFWREYTNLSCFERKYVGLKRTRIYNAVSRLAHVLYVYPKYAKAMKILNYKYYIKGMFCYLFLKDYAVYRARKAYFRHLYTQLKYEDVCIPEKIKKLRI